MCVSVYVWLSECLHASDRGGSNQKEEESFKREGAQEGNPVNEGILQVDVQTGIKVSCVIFYFDFGQRFEIFT